MAYSNKYKGKYVNIDPNNPEALGICDRSGLVFNRKDLVKQMKWSGDTKVWTGLLVGKPFLDALNDQSRPPIIGKDPEPISEPRPPKPNPPNNNIALPYKELEKKLNDYYWGQLNE